MIADSLSCIDLKKASAKADAFREAVRIKLHASVPLILHGPETEEGKSLLARKAAEVHSGLVVRHIRGLGCPSCQKQKLLEAIKNMSSGNA